MNKKIFGIGIVMLLFIGAVATPSVIGKRTLFSKTTGGIIEGTISYDGEKEKPILIEVLNGNDVVSSKTVSKAGLYRIKVSENGVYNIRASIDIFTRGRAVNQKWFDKPLQIVRVGNGKTVYGNDVTLFETIVTEEPFIALPVNSHNHSHDKRQSESISGVITYDGEQRGRFTYIKATRLSDGLETNIIVPTNDNIEFTIDLPSSGKYFVEAFRDCNGNAQRDVLEPQGKANDKRFFEDESFILVPDGNTGRVRIKLYETDFIEEPFEAEGPINHQS